MKVLLGMSGGLDSTYALSLLKNQGYEVTGAVVHMHGYTDAAAAKEMAKFFGADIIEIDATDIFKKYVVDRFAKDYLEGRTPNPCVVCNENVKFRSLFDYAMKNGFDKIATGHYADVKEKNGRWFVVPGEDKSKDQSYMLYRLGQDVLSHLILPLAKLQKTDIREKAKEKGLAVADAKESQEICFIPDNDYASYIEEHYGKSKKGKFLDVNGNAIGEHTGILHYTVGQRKGLNIALGERMYVSDISYENNTVTLAPASEPKSRTFEIDDVVFSGETHNAGDTVTARVKVRYQAKPLSCEAAFSDEKRARVTMLEDVPCAITPGQSAVFYNENGVIFGGYIKKSMKND